MTLINREEAIKELTKAQHSADYCREHRIDSCIDLGMMYIVLNRLPTQEIIHCKDCKHHWTHKCMDSMPIEICDLKQTFYDAEVDFCSLGKRREEIK